MNKEQEKTIEALQTAIQMEINGKEFYSKASRNSNNELGQKLLGKLAAEEDIHREVFENIYNSIKVSHGWPRVDYKPDYTTSLKDFFTETGSVTRQPLTDTSNELDVVRIARQMESDTFDYYTQRSNSASASAEKELFKMIAEQEQGHNLVLVDYYEYLQDPGSWFLKKEHPHLD